MTTQSKAPVKCRPEPRAYWKTYSNGETVRNIPRELLNAPEYQDAPGKIVVTWGAEK